MRFRFTIIALRLSFISSPSQGADFAKGLAAAPSGDFETALREWTPLAEQGDADAQSNLGVLYANGEGVLQDNIYAHVWLSIAASNGAKNATKNRDIVAKEMTPSQIDRAQDLALECVARNYKGC